jgi:hypothetical protein
MTSPTNPSAADIEEALAISDAETARGETMPLAPILKRLQEHADRLEAQTRNSPGQRAANCWGWLYVQMDRPCRNWQGWTSANDR